MNFPSSDISWSVDKVLTELGELLETKLAAELLVALDKLDVLVDIDDNEFLLEFETWGSII